MVVAAGEFEGRRNSRIQRLLKESELPLEKSLANFEMSRVPAKPVRVL
ncbi:MAG: hypothetical protein M3Y07_00315 [Acidobacteriota bacterium]|nr:hypothetical protein [Acidobacteriota bacterium]